MAELTELKKMLMQLSDREILELLGAKEQQKKAKKPNQKTGSWMDEQITGLNEEGLAQLKGLEAQLNNPGTAQHVDRKQLRYLRRLKSMRMEVPAFFRDVVEPKALYRRLNAFCVEHDIPSEIVGRMVPALLTYMESGHMRPVLFVGEKGCGKTTAVRMLVEEALRLPTEVIKVPHTNGGHGMTGDCGVYQSADVGCIAKARFQAKSLLVAYIFDEIDKVPHERNSANVDDELLSITDESCSDVYDNYLEATLVGLEHCPMFMTANDLQNVNSILADRCTVIRFPNANAERIRSISRKYADKKLSSHLYHGIKFDYQLMDKHIDNLVRRDVTSLRKHQQMIEAVLENALNVAMVQNSEDIVPVTEAMFAEAETAVLGAVKRSVGFSV